MNILQSLNLRRTPQSSPATSQQVCNNAGGYVFEVDDVTRLRRFLTLGVDGGTYYARDVALARENADVVAKMAESDPETLISTIVNVSTRGAAPKQHPTLFALAYAASIPSSAPLALAALPKVARTGTHLFMFADYVEQFRGWGRGLRRAIGDWYLSKGADAVAFQALKYRQRGGWSHRDLLRLSHPATVIPEMKATFEWIVRGTESAEMPSMIEAFTQAQVATDVGTWTRLIRDHRLTWEMLPDAALGEPAVWEAFWDVGMGQTALLRHLPRLTNLGLLPSMGGRTQEICSRICDAEALRKGRIHPVHALVALRTYAAGRSTRGQNTWEPTQKVIDALDAAFYAAFGTIDPAGKRTLLAVDISGSMEVPISGMPLTAREASAALALVQLATEPDSMAMGFCSGRDWRDPVLKELPLSPRTRLDAALKAINGLSMGGTDCALPMLHAAKKKLEVDTFVVYTDNETWFGEVHPFQALRQYREKSGIDAKLIVVGMTSTQFSIADPSDAGMLDIAGFDAAVPNLIGDFSRGSI